MPVIIVGWCECVELNRNIIISFVVKNLIPILEGDRPLIKKSNQI